MSTHWTSREPASSPRMMSGSASGTAVWSTRIMALASVMAASTSRDLRSAGSGVTPLSRSGRMPRHAAMNIFVAGATGALGRRLIPLLRERGHHVTGMTRTPAKQASLARAGAMPVVADLLDAAAVMAAVRKAAPDVVVHEATDLQRIGEPPPLRPRVRGHQPPPHGGDRQPARRGARRRRDALRRAELRRLDVRPRRRDGQEPRTTRSTRTRSRPSGRRSPRSGTWNVR